MLQFHLQPHALNPYVWDVPSMLKYQDPYDCLGWISLALRVSYTFCSVVGFVLISLFVYVVKTKSRGHLKAYSRMLLLCSMSDILFWIIETMCQVVGY